jgi:hypothetical protein
MVEMRAVEAGMVALADSLRLVTEPQPRSAA